MVEIDFLSKLAKKSVPEKIALLRNAGMDTGLRPVARDTVYIEIEAAGQVPRGSNRL